MASLTSIAVALAAAACLYADTRPITIDYPENGAIFPPELTAPTFLWRDAAAESQSWLIEITFADGSPALRVKSAGERLRVGPIDERCVSPTNQPPQFADARTWVPDRETWETIKAHSVAAPAKITVIGFRDQKQKHAVSQGTVTLRTSRDPVGAPIFYRDVPLMPSELEKGVIKPLAAAAIPLIAWRVRNLAEPRSRVVLEGMHVCANCHSFSLDGKTLGMDLDGPQNDKGLYALSAVQPRMSIRNEDVIQWNSFRDQPAGPMRVGFMSQVSPDGRYVVTTVGVEKDLARNYYVANFKDYRFLQVFYATRGVLVWYDRTTGERHSLPGADDPRYVQTNAVWSPDGKYLVFARAPGRDAYPEGTKLAEYANDPNETQVQYDLYRIPFNGGKGGRAEPIEGASSNGMSNSFPKVSPDGRWIVFVKARNGLLMRPDSQLYIVPFAGGEARRMRANTPLMNSWHSFSPNGRWLVFASKARSPYTQMYLTHIDEDGSDSPPILVENSTAANRAVNLPEFVNIAPDGLSKIDVPAAEFYTRFDRAWELSQKQQYAAAIDAWNDALALSPDDAKAQNNLAFALAREGRLEDAVTHWKEALRRNEEYPEVHLNLGRALVQLGKIDEAIPHWRRGVELSPGDSEAHYNLGNLLYLRDDYGGALVQWRQALAGQPNDVEALKRAAWVLATCPVESVRNAAESLELAGRAAALAPNDASTLDILAAAYAAAGRFRDALDVARRALNAAGSGPLAQGIAARMALYQRGQPFHELAR